jgi:hypothetical protein
MGRSKDVQALFERLGEFLFSDQLADFRKSAERRCESAAELFFAGGRKGETDPRFFDFLIFSHRDADGLTGLDLFLKEEGPEIPTAEREAIVRFREAVFGLFEYEEFRSRFYRVRLAGTDDRFKVKNYRGRVQEAPGAGFVGRLVPFRDLHLESGFPMPLSAEQVSIIDKIFREAGPLARRAIANPVQFIEYYLAGFLGRSPPENLRQAEILAASSFTATEFPFTVAEVKARFQQMENPSDIFKECGLIRARTRKEFETLSQAILALWNHTPRDRHGGKSVAEKDQRNRSRGKSPVASFQVIFERGEGDYGKVRVEPVGDGPPDAGTR